MHAVRFYENAEALSRVVADFLAAGLIRRQPAIAVATPDHLAAIGRQLAARCADFDRLRQTGMIVMLDAEETLRQFMVDGAPDPMRFRRAIIPVLEDLADGRAETTIRAYGEMVDVLWKAGQTLGATRLEILWNSVQATHKLSLMCGYAMTNFYQDAAVDEICSHHSHVISATGDAALIA